MLKLFSTLTVFLNYALASIVSIWKSTSVSSSEHNSLHTVLLIAVPVMKCVLHSMYFVVLSLALAHNITSYKDNVSVLLRV